MVCGFEGLEMWHCAGREAACGDAGESLAAGLELMILLTLKG